VVKNTIILDGQNLTIPNIFYLIKHLNSKVTISPDATKKAKESSIFLSSVIGQKRDNLIIYGINTGFGPMASHILAPGQLIELQKNLILSHAVGMGDPINSKNVLAAMIVRLNTLAKGYSGVSPELLKHLSQLINKRIIPIVPEHGAVGTSGDLVQLAHIALVIIGEGQALYQGKVFRTKTLYKKLNIKPYVLKPKEGLSLINGTSVMSGIGSLICTDAEQLITLATTLGALSLELVEAYSDSISQKLHDLRPHKGQVYIAKRLRSLLSSSKLLSDRHAKTSQYKTGADIKELPEAIQEVYSLRCISQILGPVYDILQKTKEDIRIEVNSVTDNPIVNVQGKNFLHGGNFHGDYVAAALDQLKASLVKLTMFSERRINYFLNKKINRQFPPFLNLKKPGLTLGLQGLQFVATSTTAYSQSLAFPHHIHSISTNGDNQDVVSMGTDAALLASKVVDNAFIVLTIEAITLCQAVDFLKIESQLSTETKDLFKKIRSVVPAVIEDRILYPQLENLRKALRSNFS